MGTSLQGHELWILLAVALAGLLVGLAVARAGGRRRAARARRGGDVGLRVAGRVLRRAGYRILETEVTGWIDVEVDGAPSRLPVRADALVERDGRRYVAEVKTGLHATRVTRRATRRQLLEYAVAFGVDAVLLVDAESEALHAVRFPALRAR